MMAKTKAQLEGDRDNYAAAIGLALRWEKRGDYAEVVSAARSSWEYVGGMLKWSKRFGDAVPTSIQGFDLVLGHAPYLLDVDAIDELSALLKGDRSIRKNFSAYDDNVERARNLVRDACHLWNHLESKSLEVPRSVRRNSDNQWSEIIERWSEMGLVVCELAGTSSRISLATDMDQVVRAKCSACGAVARGTKSQFLEDQMCPRCKSPVTFVILGEP